MNVKQLSVFIGNETGRVSQVTEIMGAIGVNIRGFSVADTADYGILRLIVDDPDKALTALQEAGFTVKVSEVICVELPDQPGGLASILSVVSKAGVNVEYVYSLISAHAVINVADPARAMRLLKDAPIKIMSQEDIAKL